MQYIFIIFAFITKNKILSIERPNNFFKLNGSITIYINLDREIRHKLIVTKFLGMIINCKIFLKIFSLFNKILKSLYHVNNKNIQNKKEKRF